MPSDGKLVYSTDPKVNQKCPKCKEVISECTCPPKVELKQSHFTAYLRIEKQGRGGKIVTVIDGLPKLEIYLKQLTTELKKACGSGGTYLMDGKEGVIEIQGDRKERLKELLAKKGIKTKG